MSSSVATTITVIAMLTLGIEQVQAKICKVECQRNEKTNNELGFDNAMNLLSVDVGTCETVYTRTEDPDGCRIPSDLDDSCYRQCIPRALNLETRSNRNGPFTIKTIKSCSATRHHCLESCERKPSYLYVFPGSKHQTRLDVGKCVGPCNNSTMGCQIIRNHSIAVEGPNGYVTIDTIEECGCGQTKCYRGDYFESFWDLVKNDENNTTSTRRVEKLINVGKCIGACEGVMTDGICAPSPEDCQFFFNSRPASCVPTSATTHHYTDLDGVNRAVAAIDTCGCGSG